MENNRNFFITIALSVLILVLWQVFYMNPRIEAQREAARIEAEQQEQAQPSATPQPGQQTAAGNADLPGGEAPSGGVPGAGGGVAAGSSRADALAASGRVAIDTPRISGSLSLTGARIDDLILKDYRTTVERNSPNIELLNPASMADGYYAEVGISATSPSVHCRARTLCGRSRGSRR